MVDAKIGQALCIFYPLAGNKPERPFAAKAERPHRYRGNFQAGIPQDIIFHIFKSSLTPQFICSL
jgi:hypothetical protein